MKPRIGEPGALGQHDVALADRAGAGEDDPRADLVGADLVERADDGFGRALHVGLDDQRQLGDLLVGELGHHLGQRRALATGRAGLLALHADAVVGELAGAGLVLDHGEGLAGIGRAVEAEDLHRHRRAGFGDLLARAR